MILLTAVLAGLVTGVARARVQGRTYAVPSLNQIWLVFLAFLLQAAVFYIPATRQRISTQAVPVFLLVSQFFLLIFVWVNRTQPGFIILGAGLALNFLVIAVNGGMMPISPETAETLIPGYRWETGMRLGWSKDIVIPREDTVFWLLSDWLLTPGWITPRYAISPGDLLIAPGAFWFLFADKAQKE